MLRLIQGFDVDEPHRTAFEGVRRVGPWEEIRTGRRVWELPSGTSGLSLQEAGKHVWNALLVAVAEVLQSAPRVAILLSGGLDSAVLAAAASVVQARLGVAPPLQVTLSFQGLQCDESEIAGRVAHSVGLPWLGVPCVGEGLEPHLEKYVAEHDSPLIDVEETVVRKAMRMAIAEGCTTIMTGNGGDEQFVGFGADVDSFRRGDLRSAWRFVRMLGETRRDRSVRSVLSAARRCLQHWISPHPYGIRAGAAAKFKSYARAALDHFLHNGMLLWRLDMLARTGRLCGIAVSHPYLNPGVLEATALASPEVLIEGGITKPVLRAAVQGHLPAELMTKLVKVSHLDFLLDTFRRESGGWAKRVLRVPDREIRDLFRRVAAGQAHVLSFWLAMTVRQFRCQWKEWK